jgi:hypothetical protein
MSSTLGPATLETTPLRIELFRPLFWEAMCFTHARCQVGDIRHPGKKRRALTSWTSLVQLTQSFDMTSSRRSSWGKRNPRGMARPLVSGDSGSKSSHSTSSSSQVTRTDPCRVFVSAMRAEIREGKSSKIEERLVRWGSMPSGWRSPTEGARSVTRGWGQKMEGARKCVASPSKRASLVGGSQTAYDCWS